jgi:EmrB/QacA subfamily drug resistance transporter
MSNAIMELCSKIASTQLSHAKQDDHIHIGQLDQHASRGEDLTMTDLETLAAPHPTRTLIAMTGSLSMIFLDATVVGVAIPTIQADLSLTTASAAWLINAFLVAFASTLAIGGRLADRYGRTTIFRIAIVMFAAGSLACAVAHNDVTIIIARAFQGIAAGLMQPAATAIVIGAFPKGKRGVAMATYFGVALLFLLAGPVIGGAIIEFAQWRWIFYLNLPVAVAAILLSLRLGLPPRTATPRGFDLVGIVLLIIGLPAFVLGLEWLGHPPEAALWLPPTLAVAGLTLTILCVLHTYRVKHPILQVRLIAARPILGQTIVLALVSLIMSSQAVYGAIYLQEVLEFTPLQAGFGSMPLLLPVLLVIRSAGKMYDRIGSKKPMTYGMLITLLGLLIEICGVWWEHYPLLAIGMALVGGGSTFATTPLNTDVLSQAPNDQRGEVSGIVQTMRQLGSSIGIVICVLAIGWSVAATMPETLPPGEAGQQAARALEGDVASLQALQISDPPLADSLRSARRRGMAAAFGIQALAAVAGCIVAFTFATDRKSATQRP